MVILTWISYFVLQNPQKATKCLEGSYSNLLPLVLPRFPIIATNFKSCNSTTSGRYKLGKPCTKACRGSHNNIIYYDITMQMTYINCIMMQLMYNMYSDNFIRSRSLLLPQMS